GRSGSGVRLPWVSVGSGGAGFYFATRSAAAWIYIPSIETPPDRAVSRLGAVGVIAPIERWISSLPATSVTPPESETVAPAAVHGSAGSKRRTDSASSRVQRPGRA